MAILGVHGVAHHRHTHNPSNQAQGPPPDNHFLAAGSALGCVLDLAIKKKENTRDINQHNTGNAKACK